MNFLFKNARRQAKHHDIVLSFFFFAQESVDQRPSIGLYRFLFHKLFNSNPNTIDESLMWMDDGAKSIVVQGWQLVPLQQTRIEAVKDSRVVR
jgi:hypothetical protein